MRHYTKFCAVLRSIMQYFSWNLNVKPIAYFYGLYNTNTKKKYELLCLFAYVQTEISDW